MLYGEMTDREVDIINQLLAERGITEYEIIGAVNEGKSLPGSTYPCEIELLSGTIVTPSAAYSFWLDWEDGHYTFWHWREMPFDTLGADKEVIIEAQKRLRQKGAT